MTIVIVIVVIAIAIVIVLVIKGVQKKTLVLNYCFAHILASIHRIFKILVPTPHNTPPIMWGRHKNFKDTMYRS